MKYTLTNVLLTENHQQVSEFLKSDLKPSSSPPSKFDALSVRLQHHIATPIHTAEFGPPMTYCQPPALHARKDIFQHSHMSPVHNYPASSSVWWNFPAEQMTPLQSLHQSSKSSSMVHELSNPKIMAVVKGFTFVLMTILHLKLFFFKILC